VASAAAAPPIHAAIAAHRNCWRPAFSSSSRWALGVGLMLSIRQRQDAAAALSAAAKEAYMAIFFCIVAAIVVTLVLVIVGLVVLVNKANSDIGNTAAKKMKDLNDGL
jgi:signal transduction histidine kinase